MKPAVWILTLCAAAFAQPAPIPSLNGAAPAGTSTADAQPYGSSASLPSATLPLLSGTDVPGVLQPRELKPALSGIVSAATQPRKPEALLSGTVPFLSRTDDPGVRQPCEPEPALPDIVRAATQLREREPALPGIVSAARQPREREPALSGIDSTATQRHERESALSGIVSTATQPREPEPALSDIVSTATQSCELKPALSDIVSAATQPREPEPALSGIVSAATQPRESEPALSGIVSAATQPREPESALSGIVGAATQPRESEPASSGIVSAATQPREPEPALPGIVSAATQPQRESALSGIVSTATQPRESEPASSGIVSAATQPREPEPALPDIVSAATQPREPEPALSGIVSAATQTRKTEPALGGIVSAVTQLREPELALSGAAVQRGGSGVEWRGAPGGTLAADEQVRGSSASPLSAGPSLNGIVTDPSGAAVPGVVVQLRGPGREQRAKTGPAGQYSFPQLAPGSYQLRFTAKGFAVALKSGLRIEKPEVFDLQLAIGTHAQVIRVEDRLHSVSAEPDENGSAIVMRERQIAALSDDPDELALQLQALAGPAPGPGGGEIFLDGFTGGNLPPKSSIREIRINANPFSPEYDRPGFSRVEIFTKPGTDMLHGQVFTQYGGDILNSRNPLLAQATRPPYRSQFYGISLTGPLRRNKASFSFDGEHRQIDENAFILATTLNGAINQALATPQSRMTARPRLDYSITPGNTLVIRYQYVKIGLDNQGAGDFNLASRAYRERQSEQTVQITETAMLSPRTINETRFQYLRSTTRDTASEIAPTIDVVGAFTGGGATGGNSGAANNNWELTNVSTLTRGRHTFKWGGRARQARLTDVSANNFAGTFTFYTLADYESGRPAQFSINTGTPLTKVSQTDAGVFVNDDWRVRPNLTVSYGLRYEVQTNLGGLGNWAPRVGIAWGWNKKTMLRGGIGVFYDRIPLSVTLNERRFDGVAQQAYFILNPAFYPVIPELAVQPQQTRPVASDLRAPRLYQISLGIERQFTQGSRLTVTWVNSRGVHLLNVRNLDQSLRLLTESAGVSRQNQVVANFNASYKKLTLFGNYALSYGKDDNEGLPADPYNLRAEWGPSSYGDIRHRGVITASAALPWGFAASPFFVVNSGPPYNITTGLDPNHTGAATARPGLVDGGFTLNPAPGTSIEHNYGRGPGAVNLGMRVSRTWSFGAERTAATATDAGSGHGGSGGASGGRRYAVTLSASTLNALNHTNFAPPNGNLSSPYFGQYRALGGMIVMNHGGGASTYNRKIDLQLRFSF